jgi:hypothetical protein
VQYHTLDFGGQLVYYPTHQFFVTSQSLWCVIFNLAAIGEARLEYWLRLIRERGGEAVPVVLVGTHSDEVVSPEAVLARVKAKLVGVGGNIRASFAVDCASLVGIPALLSQIDIMSRRLPQLRRFVPRSYVALNELVVNEAAAGRPVSSWLHFRSMAARCGIGADGGDDSEKRVQAAARFLHEAGAILRFEDRTNVRLNDTVVLDLRWLSSAMATLFTTHHRWVRNGRVSIADLRQHVWRGFDEVAQTVMVDILERLDVCYMLPDRVSLLVPSLMGEATITLDLDAERATVARRFDAGILFEFAFLPIGFFGRFVARCLHISGLCVRCLSTSGFVVDDLRRDDGQLHRAATVLFDAASRRLVFLREAADVVLETANSDGVNGAEESSSRAILGLLSDCFMSLIESSFERMLGTIEQSFFCSTCLCDIVAPSPQALEGATRFSMRQVLSAMAADAASTLTAASLLPCAQHSVPIDNAPHIVAPSLQFSEALVIDSSRLTVSRKLGQGGFGSVFMGRLDGVCDVALKELDDEAVSSEAVFTAFQIEVKMMQSLAHPNVARLYGVSLSPLRMVLQFAPLGDLDALLRSSAAISSELGLRIALDVARGLAHLHEQCPPICHRDLRSPNVFILTTDWRAPAVAVIGDFGLARSVEPSVGGFLKAWQWLAPEVIDAQSTTYDERSDVYSLGMVLYEIATRARPFDEFWEDTRFVTRLLDGDGGSARVELREIEIKSAILEAGLRPTVPAECVFGDVLRGCWQASPERRMAGSEVVQRLERLMSERK